MKLITFLSIILFLSMPFISEGQNDVLGELKNITNALSGQDTAKQKNESGIQSNLAVTDEGAPADKSKINSKRSAEDPGKVNNNASQNNNSGTTSNLAVTDEGAPADKSKNKNNQQKATGNSTPEQQKESQPNISNPK